MELKKYLLAFAIVCGTAGILKAQQADGVSFNPNAKFDSSKKSFPAAVKENIGQATVAIAYHSPGVRKRVIWGGLIPYDEVWVTGAHSATALEVDKDFMVGNTKIPAGKYAIFTIPGKDEWTIIINKNFEQHLADDYDEKDDLVRIQVKPVVPGKTLERLQYFIKKLQDNSGTIAVGWENLLVQFDIKII